MQTDVRNEMLWVSVVVLAFVALRLVAAAVVPISPDEAYYFAWSRFPSASYYDHPPMAAWWIAASSAIFGDGPFGIRAVTVLSAIPTSAAVYFTGKALFDVATASRAVLWLNVTLLIGVGGFIATPDAASVMFWTLAIWALAELVRSNDRGWWLVVGAFAGLGVLSKLTDLFLGVGVLAALLTTRDLRRWLLSPWLWAGAIIATTVVTPMLLWNASHDWVTLTKQFGRIGTGGLQPLKFPEFVATQFGLLNPLVATFVGLAAVVWIARNRRYPVAGMGLLLWTALPLIAYMAFHSLHQQVQGNWLAPVYPTLALAAAAAAQAAPDAWAGLRRVAFPVGAALVILGLVLAANPAAVLPPYLDAGQALRGWDQVAGEADALRRGNGAEWIAGTNYSQVAELAYHLRDTAPVAQINERARYSHALPDTTLLTKPVLIITKGTPDFLARCFAGLTEVGKIERRSGDTVWDTFTAYRGEGAAAGAFDPGCDRLP